MKTNQVLTRTMGEFSVYQRTSDGMFNATSILTYYNRATGLQKQMSHFFENNQTTEFMLQYNSDYTASRASRGRNGGTWMDVSLFLVFLEWLLVGVQGKIIITLSSNRGISLKEAINRVLSDTQLEQINKKDVKTYIMVDDESGYYKIGKSVSPEFREKTLCYATPKIRTVAVHEEDIEGRLHHKYDDFRIRGEWFSLSESQVNNIITKYKFQTN